MSRRFEAMTDRFSTRSSTCRSFHRDHEKFYAPEPRLHAVTLQRHARAPQALADRWSTVEPREQTLLRELGLTPVNRVTAAKAGVAIRRLASALTPIGPRYPRSSGPMAVSSRVFCHLFSIPRPRSSGDRASVS